MLYYIYFFLFICLILSIIYNLKINSSTGDTLNIFNFEILFFKDEISNESDNEVKKELEFEDNQIKNEKDFNDLNDLFKLLNKKIKKRFISEVLKE